MRTAKGRATCRSTSGTQEEAGQWHTATGLGSVAGAFRVPAHVRGVSMVAAPVVPHLVLGMDGRWVVKRVYFAKERRQSRGVGEQGHHARDSQGQGGLLKVSFWVALSSTEKLRGGSR